MSRINAGLSATVLLLIISTTYATDHIDISDAWIAEAPPVSSINAGYVQIENHGEEMIRLVSVSSPVFEKIELHKNVMENNLASMQYFASIEIGPGQSLRFQPGDFHMMLYNAADELKSGDSVPLSFAFSNGASHETQAQVRKLSDLQPQHSHVHGHEPTTGPNMIDRIKVAYQHLLPQHLLSGLMYRLTRNTSGPLKNFLITSFIKIFNVDMSIATRANPDQFRHFNDFFTRELKPEARPIDSSSDSVVSPVDGAVSQFGNISDGKIIQAKGRDYSVRALLGGDQQMADTFADGNFITIYLSPKDYHRIHMPLDGRLKTMTYIPGDLFSVDPTTTQGLDNLFARNERVIQVFETEIGSVALIMVGAIFVGSMETVWAGEITPASDRNQLTTNYDGNDSMPIRLHKGAEMGRFNMGSTVILLFQKDRLRWDSSIQPDQGVILGRKLAVFK